MDREKIRDIVIKVLEEQIFMRKLADIDDDYPLGEDGLGVDSISFIRFLSILERELRIRIKDDFWIYEKMGTIRKLTDYFCN